MAMMSDQKQLPDELNRPVPAAMREALLKQLNKFRGRHPEDFVFDRDEANRR